MIYVGILTEAAGDDKRVICCGRDKLKVLARLDKQIEDEQIPHTSDAVPSVLEVEEV